MTRVCWTEKSDHCQKWFWTSISLKKVIFCFSQTSWYTSFPAFTNAKLWLLAKPPSTHIKALHSSKIFNKSKPNSSNTGWLENRAHNHTLRIAATSLEYSSSFKVNTNGGPVGSLRFDDFVSIMVSIPRLRRLRLWRRDCDSTARSTDFVSGKSETA